MKTPEKKNNETRLQILKGEVQEARQKSQAKTEVGQTENVDETQALEKILAEKKEQATLDDIQKIGHAFHNFLLANEGEKFTEKEKEVLSALALMLENWTDDPQFLFLEEEKKNYLMSDAGLKKFRERGRAFDWIGRVLDFANKKLGMVFWFDEDGQLDALKTLQGSSVGQFFARTKNNWERLTGQKNAKEYLTREGVFANQYKNIPAEQKEKYQMLRKEAQEVLVELGMQTKLGIDFEQRLLFLAKKEQAGGSAKKILTENLKKLNLEKQKSLSEVVNFSFLEDPLFGFELWQIDLWNELNLDTKKFQELYQASGLLASDFWECLRNNPETRLQLVRQSLEEKNGLEKLKPNKNVWSVGLLKEMIGKTPEEYNQTIEAYVKKNGMYRMAGDSPEAKAENLKVTTAEGVITGKQNALSALATSFVASKEAILEEIKKEFLAFSPDPNNYNEIPNLNKILDEKISGLLVRAFLGDLAKYRFRPEVRLLADAGIVFDKNSIETFLPIDEDSTPRRLIFFDGDKQIETPFYLDQLLDLKQNMENLTFQDKLFFLDFLRFAKAKNLMKLK